MLRWSMGYLSISARLLRVVNLYCLHCESGIELKGIFSQESSIKVMIISCNTSTKIVSPPTKIFNFNEL